MYINVQSTFISVESVSLLLYLRPQVIPLGQVSPVLAMSPEVNWMQDQTAEDSGLSRGTTEVILVYLGCYSRIPYWLAYKQ